MLSNFRLFIAVALISVAPACGVASTLADGTKPRPLLAIEERRGLDLAKQRCSACHAVTENGISPNPESPPFEDIANRPGITTATIGLFLRDSHNFPAAMNFRLDDIHVSDLSQYILTMKKLDYRPDM